MKRDVYLPQWAEFIIASFIAFAIFFVASPELRRVVLFLFFGEELTVSSSFFFYLSSFYNVFLPPMSRHRDESYILGLENGFPELSRGALCRSPVL